MFGIDLFDLSLLPALLVALAAGLLSFLSPCVLPIVPPYLAYMSGVSVTEMQGRSRALLPAVFFVLGLSTVFLLMGFTASAFGRFFLIYRDVFATAAGIVIMIFGAHFIGVFRLSFLDRDLRLDAGERGGSSLGAYVLGLAFAFGWTPCIGPILGFDPDIGGDRGLAGPRHAAAGRLRAGAGRAVPAGRGVLSAHGRVDAVPEAAHGADRADHGAAAVDRRVDDADWPVHGDVELAAEHLSGDPVDRLSRPAVGVPMGTRGQVLD